MYKELKTPLGPMVAIADAKALYVLEFVDGLDVKELKATLPPGETKPLKLIEEELQGYFNHTLRQFKTPVHLEGTPFQKAVWRELSKIPYGKTYSYSQLASAIGKPSAFRASAGACGANCLAIIVPCHRVINIQGSLGGYNGGIERKEWLLRHESEGSR